MTTGKNDMDMITIINYQGSKKNLLNFIHSNLDEYINEDDVILDIFSGTSSVAYSYKATNTVYANDAELYGSTIASALLGNKVFDDINDKINGYLAKYNNPSSMYSEWIDKERELIEANDIDGLIGLYDRIPTVWKNGEKYFDSNNEYSLFMKYYSTSYFGIKQARDIDSLRFSIEFCDSKEVLLSCLFYAMKECVFSKDGHMAQPLDLRKNEKRLFKLRKKDVVQLFFEKLEDFKDDKFVKTSRNNKVFNLDYQNLIDNYEEIKNVTVIYADPPYTDMQYSRYYHLLNTVIEYDYPDLTISNGGYTKGLYLDNRFQSQLSKKSTCLNAMEKLIEYSYRNNILLAISFAYPRNVNRQKTDRYVMNIDDLIDVCKKYYSADRVVVKKQDYKHSNNRNSESKRVLEYLIICERV